MDKDYILSVARTIKSQLVATADPNVICSWGISNPMATVFRNMPAFAFIVDGRLFKGGVLIALNSSDLYEIYLVKSGSETCLCNEAYADQLVSIIDTAVESGNDPEEYEKFCQSQLGELVQVITL